MTHRVAVVGAGVAGLAAARALASDHDVVVFDRAGRAGGKVRSTSFRGRPFDVGPDAFITRNPTATRLVTELGLANELIAPAASSAAIYSRRRLRPFPSGLALGVPTDLRALSRSGVVSRRGVLRAAMDLVLPGRQPSDLVAAANEGRRDPSVATLVGRRLGREVLAALVDPLIGGINASDVASLSFVASAPQLAVGVAGKRSITRALRPPSPTARPAGEAPPPIFFGLEHGLGTLVDALAAEVVARGAKIELGSTVTSARRDDAGGWSLGDGADAVHADAIILAVPAYVAAAILAEGQPELSRLLGAIPYASVATATFAWPATAVPPATTKALASVVRASSRPGAATGSADVLPGSGVLVARTAGHFVTAVTFTSTKWPRSATPGEIVVRASAGRHGDARVSFLDDEALAQAIRAELGEIIGVTAPPLDQLVERWPESFPQYVSGHLALVSKLRSLAASCGALALCGAPYDGIGIPACIDSGERAATEVAALLAG